MVYDQKMEDIFREDVPKLSKELGASDNSVISYVINSVRRHKRKQKEVTKESVLQDLQGRQEYWNNITSDNEVFERVIEYYVFWESLNREEKEEYKETRRDVYDQTDFKGLRKSTWAEISKRYGRYYISWERQQALCRMIVLVKIGTEKEDALEEAERINGVDRKIILRDLDFVGHDILE